MLVAIVSLLALTRSLSASAQSTSAAASPSGQAVMLEGLIKAGTLPDLERPTFTDYRDYIEKFYQQGGHSLAWVAAYQPTPQALILIRNFKQASLKGLNPDDYDASRWDARMAKITSAGSASDADRVHFDLALTICAMRYISDLHIGRVNPQHFKFGLTAGPNRYDLAEMLRTQVMQAQDVDQVIDKVEPPFAGYKRAEAALAAYMKLAAEGDGPLLPVPVKAIRPRGTYPAIGQLAARLRQLGDLPADLQVSDSHYQGAIVDAVKHFQRRHGLEIDGVLGKGTIAVLNQPLRMRVRQLVLTLERYRWSPPDFPEPPIMVNIPEFRLRTFRGQPAAFLTMKVIVGRAYRTRTPVFADQMKYVVFRPYWNVPLSIQRNELVPKTTRDRNYIAENDYEVVDAAGNVITDGAVSDEVLARMRSGSLFVRQKPGPKNALGLVKFIFPNSYNVYFHSTPVPELFSHARRDFSHGCIRVEDPQGLAAWVLRDKPQWTLNKIRAAMNGDQTIQVNLGKPIPVLILYSTAVVEPDEEVRFFDDIYGYDASLEKVLAAGYPYPG